MAFEHSEAERNRALADQCRAVSLVAQQSTEWMRGAASVAAEDRPALERECRRVATKANHLARAAERPMCISVFGASQAGKSYLISALARHGQQPLRVEAGDASVDFLAQINPVGGGESTGLVTRFSIHKRPGLPDLPIVLRLLSQSDVVRIVANGFLADVDRDGTSPPAVARLSAVVQTAQAARQPGAVGGFSESDVLELQEYLDRYFRSHPVVTGLGSEYWTAAAATAPLLSPAERATLFSPIWGELPELTGLCARLLTALAELGDATEAFCALDALMPREDSIIAVNTLDRLGEADGSQVTVGTAAGRRVALPRPVVAALVAELRLVLTEKPFDFFEHTDLLDFPGGRSRENIADLPRFLAQPGNLSLFFRRGKVAYLYQAYLAEQELTAMLLCVGPSVQEVRTMPGMVMEWIEATHGATPAARAGKPTGLFLVLTMFDRQFDEKAGGQEPWSTRLEGALDRFLTLEFDWHKRWQGDAPFNNTYWFRNPTIRAKALLDYDESGLETGLREPQRIAAQEAEYLADPLVRRHFREPARAWAEAFRLNDGGLTYLADNLRPLCDPQLKRTQVGTQLHGLAAGLRARLAPYYVSDDAAAAQEQRMNEAFGVVESVQRIGEDQRLGLLLRSLQIPPLSLQGPFYAVQRSAPLSRRVSTNDIGARLRERWGRPTQQAPEPEADRAVDLSDMLAQAAIQDWTGRLHAFGARADLEQAFGFSREQGATLIKVLSESARRLGLRPEVAARIREHYNANAEPWLRVRVPSMLAEEMINQFVATIGRPEILRVAPDPGDTALPPLTEERTAYEAEYLFGWCDAFMQRAQENASAGLASDFDAQANLRRDGRGPGGAVIHRAQCSPLPLVRTRTRRSPAPRSSSAACQRRRSSPPSSSVAPMSTMSSRTST
jgi:hypothetical protein